MLALCQAYNSRNTNTFTPPADVVSGGSSMDLLSHQLLGGARGVERFKHAVDLHGLQHTMDGTPDKGVHKVGMLCAIKMRLQERPTSILRSNR